MTIRACLHNGRIHPLDPLPPDWADGQALVIEPSEHEEGFTYNSLPPLRSHSVDAVFDLGGEVLPVPFDLVDEE
jgi:hypothetical protein